MVRVGESHRYCSYAYDTDPGTDLIRLRFQWGDGQETWDPEWRYEGTWTCIAHSYQLPALRTIKVQASDLAGNPSPWSDGFMVDVKANHYALEAKAWIPQWRAVDPALMTGPGWATYTPGITDGGRECYNRAAAPQQFNGWFAGDNHVPYDGTHRLIMAAEFDVSGTGISNFVTAGNYGETLRIRSYRWADGYVETCIFDRMTVNHAFSVQKTAANAFQITYDSPNPFFDGPLYPTVSGTINGRFEGDGSIVLGTTLDQFPSHGFRIYRNGGLAFELHQDVSCLSDDEVMGANGFFNIGGGLSSGRSESFTLPAGAEGGTTYRLSDLC